MKNEIYQLSEYDQRRFDSLMQESYRKVFNMAYRLAGSRTDAEDLTQEAFFRAYRSFLDYEGDRPFENWIFRIVTRLFLDLLRSRRRRIKPVSFDAPLNHGVGDENLFFEVPDDSSNPENKVMSGTFSEDLQRAMNSLSPEQRLLVTLADIEEIPYKEIAEMIGKPVGTIRSRLHRTHKLIRAKLEQGKAKTAPSATPAIRFAPSHSLG
jgi:RNA polymerase sigma-70 factor, ECF subfamily